MTVRELINKLLLLQRPNAEVTMYVNGPDDFMTIGKVKIADNGNQVRLHSQYAVDGNLC